MRYLRTIRASKRRQAALGVIGVILLISGGAIYGVRLLNGPAEGSIIQAAPVSSRLAADPHGAPSTYRGAYLTFTVPADYEQLQPKLSGSYVEVAGYYSTDHRQKHIAVAVVRESLDSDSGLSYRQTHPALYHQTAAQGQGLIFARDDASGSERTAYLTHDGVVASVAISSPFQTDLQPDLQAILTSLVWRQT
jgi:hypothetical protein